MLCLVQLRVIHRQLAARDFWQHLQYRTTHVVQGWKESRGRTEGRPRAFHADLHASARRPCRCRMTSPADPSRSIGSVPRGRGSGARPKPNRSCRARATPSYGVYTGVCARASGQHGSLSPVAMMQCPPTLRSAPGLPRRRPSTSGPARRPCSRRSTAEKPPCRWTCR